MTQHKALTWIGWGLTGLLGAMLAASATLKLTSSPEFADEFVKKLGYPRDVLLILGIVELSCAIIFLVPQTAILGTVLLTGYFGGAIASHVRINEDFLGALLGGILVWLAVYLRDPRVRALLPIRWSM